MKNVSAPTAPRAMSGQGPDLADHEVLPEMLPETRSEPVSSGSACAFQTAIAGLPQGHERTERNHNPRVGGSSPSSATLQTPSEQRFPAGLVFARWAISAWCYLKCNPRTQIQRVERRGWGGETGVPWPSLERCDASSASGAVGWGHWVWGQRQLTR